MALFCTVMGCRKPASTPAAPRLPARVLVGATLPFSGREAQASRFYEEGYQLAFEQANAAGGALAGTARVPVQLEILDDKDDPKTGLSQMQVLLEKGATFFLGSSSPAVIEAQSALAESRHLPYLAAAGSSKPLFARGFKYFFGLQAPVELLAYTQLRWIDEQQKAKLLPTPLSVALLVQDTPRGQEFRKGVLEFLEKTPNRRLSYRLAFDESFPPGTQDFAAPLRRLREARADVFLADTSLSEFVALHRQYLALGLCHKVLGYGSHGSELEAQETLGFGGLAYVLSAVWWTNRLASQGLNRRFVEAFKDDYHRNPDWYSALSYEAARVLIAAIGAGNGNPEQARAQLAGAKMETILPGGRLVFGNDQQAIYPFIVQQNQPDGSAPIVFPRELAETPGTAANPRCP